MASQTEIANIALTKLGDARILALTDDIEAARVISAVWDHQRDLELRAHNWNFSMKRTTLAALTSTPAWGYAYQYQQPSDCLRVVQVGEYAVVSLSDYRGEVEAPFQIEGRYILTDLTAPLPIRYVSRVETTTTWDSLFVEVFACRVAATVCDRLTQSNTKRQLAWEEYANALRLAVRSDAVENPANMMIDDSWVLSRL